MHDSITSVFSPSHISGHDMARTKLWCSLRQTAEPGAVEWKILSEEKC